jgi:hypothetical protein
LRRTGIEGRRVRVREAEKVEKTRNRGGEE